MRTISSLIILLLLSIASAQDGKRGSQQQEQPKTPATLVEAHAALERILSPQTLAEIDAMPSEKRMSQYHMGLGLGIRNNWGLWSGSPLAKHMEELGFTHPDDMSGVILETFWCKRHGQSFRLKERAAELRKTYGIDEEVTEGEMDRVKKTKAALPNMMMGLHFEKRDVPTVRMPNRGGHSLRVRFLSSFRVGVLITFRAPGGRTWDGDVFATPSIYFDAMDRRLHPIRVREVSDVQSAVVIGNRAWFAGTTDGKAVLVGVNGRDRVVLPLPQGGPSPQLGIDDQSLLAVYPRTILRLTDRTWTLVRSVDFALPCSGVPPQLHDKMLFFRDEGARNGAGRLWWLTLGEEPRLMSFDRDTGLRGPKEPVGWFSDDDSASIAGLYNALSFCAMRNGDLWVCVGTEASRKSVFRRAKDGSYSIAVMHNSVRFGEDAFGTPETDQGLSVSAVAALPDDTLLLVGDGGLYRLKGSELVQELAFTNTYQKVSGSDRIEDHHPWYWVPSNILVLDDKSYLIGGLYGGVHLLCQDREGQWSFQSLDDMETGAPVVW